MKLSRTAKIILAIIVVLAVLGAGGGALAWQQSKNPPFCANCHIIEPYYEGWKDSDLLANAHAEEDVVCKECHVTTPFDAAGEAIAYVTGSYEDPLEERTFPPDMCYECHEQDTYAQLVQPADQQVNAGGECETCHKVHRSVEAINVCLTCHGPFEELTQAVPNYVTADDEEVNPHVTLPHDSEDPVLCDNCHEKHPVHVASVDAEGVAQPDVEFCYSCHHQRDFTPCSECHEE